MGGSVGASEGVGFDGFENVGGVSVVVGVVDVLLGSVSLCVPIIQSGLTLGDQRKNSWDRIGRNRKE